ncbi:uncharacterized protein LAESUDRAFT_65654 [Laetiporus sulphureus 93-53]|uniref:Uncharacterized protein n=1 Tax=Laetiporus sulphureus 93-53 TaxID=1314785 RepID=A0A165F4Y9_9APHY|nr:uncharacterized protein LAESUDRAFT_65654 [Laetiporus sulphureus 93-53]KZT08400.1 hypothetical protein LAESUDRAFT_65654 [Laetiporus sulphureus 93-53]
MCCHTISISSSLPPSLSSLLPRPFPPLSARSLAVAAVAQNQAALPSAAICLLSAHSLPRLAQSSSTLQAVALLACPHLGESRPSASENRLVFYLHVHPTSALIDTPVLSFSPFLPCPRTECRIDPLGC